MTRTVRSEGHPHNYDYLKGIEAASEDPSWKKCCMKFKIKPNDFSGPSILVCRCQPPRFVLLMGRCKAGARDLIRLSTPRTLRPSGGLNWHALQGATRYSVSKTAMNLTCISHFVLSEIKRYCSNPQSPKCGCYGSQAQIYCSEAKEEQE